MGPKIIFLRWFLMAVLILTCLTIMFQVDGFRWVNDNDASKISFVILAIFIGATFWCGYLSWKMDSLLENKSCEATERYQKNLINLELKTDHGWYLRILCAELGMLGTIIGLILGLENFTKISSINIEDVMQLLAQSVKYLGTAFLTTGVGLTAGILLSFQLQNLCSKIDSEKKESNYDQK